MPFEGLLLEYGLIALFIGAFVEGELCLILAGYLAHRGFFPLSMVMLVSAAGSLTGDYGLFFIGRRYAAQLIARYPKVAAGLERMHVHIHAHETLFVLSMRLFYGLRLFTSMLLGTTHIKTKKFLGLTALSTVIWTVAFTVLGYSIGYAVIPLFLKLKSVIAEVLIVGITTIVLVLIVKRILKRTPESLDK